VEELGGEGREEGGGEGVGAPFNVLPQGATDVVAPLARLIAPVVTTTSIILCFNKHWLTQVHLENDR